VDLYAKAPSPVFFLSQVIRGQTKTVTSYYCGDVHARSVLGPMDVLNVKKVAGEI
jgi:hypothetical protein